MMNGLSKQWKLTTGCIVVAATLFYGGWQVAETLATKNYVDTELASNMRSINLRDVRNELFYWQRMEMLYEDNLDACVASFRPVAECNKIRYKLKRARDNIDRLKKRIEELKKRKM